MTQAADLLNEINESRLLLDRIEERRKIKKQVIRQGKRVKVTKTIDPQKKDGYTRGPDGKLRRLSSAERRARSKSAKKASKKSSTKRNRARSNKKRSSLIKRG